MKSAAVLLAGWAVSSSALWGVAVVREQVDGRPLQVVAILAVAFALALVLRVDRRVRFSAGTAVGALVTLSVSPWLPTTAPLGMFVALAIGAMCASWGTR